MSRWRTSATRAPTATTPATTTPVEPFPVFTLSAVTMRSDPIYLSTFTGRPPDEPSVLGEALNEVFVPLLQQQFPEIVDFWLPPEGCSYRIAVVSVKKAYPGHARRVMMAVWSALGQFMYTKFVIVGGRRRRRARLEGRDVGGGDPHGPRPRYRRDRERADRLPGLRQPRLGPGRQAGPGRHEQASGRDDARVGPADPHVRRDDRGGHAEVGRTTAFPEAENRSGG